MFVDFFYALKKFGIPVNPTAFLALHQAFSIGLVEDLNDFYVASRSILVKSEKYFDTFDQVFSHYFHEAPLPEIEKVELDKIISKMLQQWLEEPEFLASALNIDTSTLNKMSPEELIEYFRKHLEEQSERHDGGSKWIGTGGTSPVGHSGHHPSGMRVGGKSRNKSAIKVAMERRFKDYSMSGPITHRMIGEALQSLKNLTPSGPKDQVDIDKTISLTIKNAGEIEICFDRKLKNRLKIILAIDNGGWSMDPHVSIVSTLFHYARAQFKEIKTYFFHNTIYETIWEDPQRHRHPFAIKELTKEDQDTRLIIVGDASMAPYEIMANNGSLYSQTNTKSSIECLKFLRSTFLHSVWLNPIPVSNWKYIGTINTIGDVFSMFELSINGLEKAISHLTSK